MPHAGLDASRSSTGVIWCTERASEYGFLDEPEAWANLGQGAPEVEDDIAGCFKRPETINLSVAAREYGPTAGIKPLREAVAKLYNEMHRQGKESKYTWENVAIVPGGRAGLIRIAAVLGSSYLSFFLPDYTAYNEMLSLFKNVSLCWIFDGLCMTTWADLADMWYSSRPSPCPSPKRTATTSTPTRLPRKSPVVPPSSLPPTPATLPAESLPTRSWPRFRIFAEAAPPLSVTSSTLDTTTPATAMVRPSRPPRTSRMLTRTMS